MPTEMTYVCNLPDITAKEDNIFYDDEQILLELTWKNKADIENLCLRVEVSDYRRYPVTAFVVENSIREKRAKPTRQN